MTYYCAAPPLLFVVRGVGAKFQRVMREMSDVLTGKVAPPQPAAVEVKTDANGVKA